MEEEQAKQAALKEDIEAAHEKVNGTKAGRKGKKKEATQKAKAGVTAASSHDTKVPNAVLMSCGVKAAIITTQMEKPKPK